MANDGLQQLMNGGVVISGDEPRPVEMGEAEAILSFAVWLAYVQADGSIPFEHLARRFIDAQGWEVEDPNYASQLRTPPRILGSMDGTLPEGADPREWIIDVEDEPQEVPEPAPPVEVTPGMVSPAGAVIISGGQDMPPVVGGEFTDPQDIR